VSFIKVSISDPISKIYEVFSQDKISGSLMNNGKVIQNPKDLTFAKAFIHEGSKFGMLSGVSSVMKPLKWTRFKDKSSGAWHISESSTDAVVFIPKRDIYFLGFGAYANHYAKDMTMTIWWFVGD